MSSLEATLVGISAQSVDSHSAFSAKLRLNVPLLADRGGMVAKLYGASRGRLGTKRAVVIVDEAGVIRYRHDHTFGLDYQTADQLAEALAGMPAG
jgi:peroxiredoxin Q/BCP